MEGTPLQYIDLLINNEAYYVFEKEGKIYRGFFYPKNAIRVFPEMKFFISADDHQYPKSGVILYNNKDAFTYFVRNAKNIGCESIMSAEGKHYPMLFLKTLFLTSDEW